MRPNILLVILDGVRARNTSLFDHKRDTTPELENFTTEATVYTQARAPGNWSIPSHTSIFTGHQVPEHKITVQYDHLCANHTIWERLQDDYNYRTGVFSQNEFITTEQYGLSRGFDTVVGPVSTRAYPYENAYTPSTSSNEVCEIDVSLKNIIANSEPGRSLLNYIVHIAQNISYRVESSNPWVPYLPYRPQYQSPARVHIERFLEWESQVQQPWAACLNFMDANTMHFPWPEPQRWTNPYQRMIMRELDNLRWDFQSGQQPWWKLQALEPRYDDAIYQLDSEFGRLVRALKSRGEFDKTLLVVTSDHGDALGERSRVRPRTRLASHSAGIHESLLHVPLVVSSVNQRDHRTVNNPVSLAQFPQVVEHTISKPESSPSFQSDAPVVAAAYHDRLFEYLLTADEWNIGDYIDDIDISKFRGDAHAVYEAEGNGVRKHVTWGDDQAVVQVESTDAEYKSGLTGREKVKSIFERFRDMDIKSTHESVDSIDESTLRHLRDLGYTN